MVLTVVVNIIVVAVMVDFFYNAFLINKVKKLVYIQI